MNVLAIDTASEAMGLALATREGRLCVLVERAGLRHAEALAPAIETLLARGGIRARELELVVCSLGPGSFTGVRIGMATAKGIAVGTGCDLVGIPGLDALARRLSFFPGIVAPVVDARRGRVYAATYRGGKRTSEFLDLEPETLAAVLLGAACGSSLLLTGPHARSFLPELERTAAEREGSPELHLDGGFADTDPQALLELGKERHALGGPDIEPLAPLYLRPSEAERVAEARTSGGPATAQPAPSWPSRSEDPRPELSPPRRPPISGS